MFSILDNQSLSTTTDYCLMSIEAFSRCRIHPLDVSGLVIGILCVVWYCTGVKHAESACQHYSANWLLITELCTGILFILTSIISVVYRCCNRLTTPFTYLSILSVVCLFTIFLLCLIVTSLTLDFISEVRATEDEHDQCTNKTTITVTCILLITSIGQLTYTSIIIRKTVHRNKHMFRRRWRRRNRQEIQTISRQILMASYHRCQWTSPTNNDEMTPLMTLKVATEQSRINQSNNSCQDNSFTMPTTPSRDLCQVYCYDDGIHPVFSDTWRGQTVTCQKTGGVIRVPDDSRSTNIIYNQVIQCILYISCMMTVLWGIFVHRVTDR